MTHAVAPAGAAPEPGLGDAEIAAFETLAARLPGGWRAERFADETGAAALLLSADWDPDLGLVLHRGGGFARLALLRHDTWTPLALAPRAELLAPAVRRIAEELAAAQRARLPAD